VDYSFHLIINDNYHAELASEFSQLRKAGIISIKLFTTYKDAGYMLDREKWRGILEACRDAGLVVTVHAEDDAVVQGAVEQGRATGNLEPRDHPDLRPSQAEATAVQQLIDLAEATGCQIYIVHLSTGSACRLLWEAQERNVPVIVETTPHYLLLERSMLEGSDGPNHLMTPPLREHGDNRILWQGVIDGTISVIATDHCAFTPEQKALGRNALDILPGIPCVETLFPIFYTYGVAEGRIGLPQLVRVLSENPARIFGLWPQKGSLEIGTDADLVVYDPLPHRTLTNDGIHSRAGYSSFAGLQVKGQVDLTMLRGKILVQNGQFMGLRGQGQFIPAGS
jgi:dihydropyrimidinase